MRQIARVVLVSLLLALASAPLTAAAQGARQVYRIGWLWGWTLLSAGP
jgi:hypothetical protein